ncbi:hypothetical protein J6590_033328 [Homalodisca vitripennis]|nr:hypothetical protein J6590_033328 [Homalodisca vitripennis]
MFRTEIRVLLCSPTNNWRYVNTDNSQTQPRPCSQHQTFTTHSQVLTVVSFACSPNNADPQFTEACKTDRSNNSTKLYAYSSVMRESSSPNVPASACTKILTNVRSSTIYTTEPFRWYQQLEELEWYIHNEIVSTAKRASVVYPLRNRFHDIDN